MQDSNDFDFEAASHCGGNHDPSLVRFARKVIDATRAESDEVIAELAGEVESVLLLMDGLAEQWGDEGVFRRCRDRLRATVAKAKTPATASPANEGATR